MTKQLIGVSLLVLAIAGLPKVSWAQEEVLKKIEFTSLTRGHNERMEVSENEFISEVNKDAYNNETPAKYWKHLNRQVAKLDLSSVDKLKSPTNKRAFDGAKHSTLTIVTSRGTYRHLFDDENPNEALSEVMKCIVSLRESIKE